MSRNLRTALIFGGFISLIGAAFYPIYFRPLMRLEEYQKEQAVNRAGIVQEDVQPPGNEKAVANSGCESRRRHASESAASPIPQVAIEQWLEKETLPP
ncbi:PREDICTED: small integral membrane protein 20 isoform X1 [Hipposideros armiger]|uniref:Small integral membrane protein 20 isoform X1 n=1 Tax=Hipposideros armiger TaxID=186990 RepID=A0A8B7RA97_HIPAR|nr:PREDICTED: small integral membrane protein 20 isoform X1 [Hipposideros armiger]